MSMKPFLLILITSFLYSTPSIAQDSEDISGWSIGTSLTYPIAEIYQLHINYRFDERHEILFGPAYQNFKSGDIRSHAYTLLIGYRYYIWKGLHVETEFWPAYNRMYSEVTDSYYPGIELWGEFKIGYTFNLGQKLFLQPAPGLGFGLMRTNRPPNFSEDITSPIFTPQLILGIKL
jgi:hypothetical protein